MDSEIAHSIATMQKHIERFPALLESNPLEETILSRCQRIAKGRISGLCLTGMGGSSIANQYVQILLESKTNVPISYIQNYVLPAHVDSNHVVIAVSYSGDTEETLSTYADAINRNCAVLTVTAGGLLAQRSKHNAAIPSGLPPRAALPVLLSKVLPMAEAICGLPTTEMSGLRARLEGYLRDWSAPSDLARKVVNKIPLFIGGRIMTAVAYRAKCQVNENAKMEAFCSNLPEANHNELEGFNAERSELIQPVFLCSHHDGSAMEKRFAATIRILDDMGFGCISLQAPEDGAPLDQMMALTHFLDMVSLELARLREVDPVGVPKISRLKRMLA